MSLPKILAILTTILFCIIGIAALFKTQIGNHQTSVPISQEPLEVELDDEIQTIAPVHAYYPTTIAPSEVVVNQGKKEDVRYVPFDLPEGDRIEELFNIQEPQLDIVETIIYKSHVPWQKGRPAWLSDYASYYNTSKHFIARSLNKKPDYWKQEVKEGDRFNVFRKDRNIQFHLIVDSSRCKMWLYCLDLDKKQKILLKTYPVSLGRVDSSKTSGLLTPLGTYTLGSKIAIYKPKVMGTHLGQKKELITVFGTRWIPFEKEVGLCTQPAKGFGIHGTPWVQGSEGVLVDNSNSIGKYESDGCIRLKTNDIEEIFSIIITKSAMIEIVRDFSEATFSHIGF